MTAHTPLRWKDPGTGLGTFSGEFLIQCPRCKGQAQVARTWNTEHRHWRRATMTCVGCGLSRKAEAQLHCHLCPLPPGSRWVGPATVSARCRCGRCGVWLELDRRLKVPPKQDFLQLHCDGCGEDTRSSYVLHQIPLRNAATDRCFGFPLWLQTPSAGQTLWAFNAPHLAFLRAWLTATIRERGPSTSSAAARLPGWLKRTNRTVALRAVARLERRLLSR
jgi:hypothetical protein